MARYSVTSGLFFIFLVIVRSAVVDILCSEEFCEKEVDCKSVNQLVPENCRIQNSTHSGTFLPYAGPCNCCEYCLKNLDEGDLCSRGEPGQSTTNTVCGDMLYCYGEDNDTDIGNCIPIDSTDCAKEQSIYDEKVMNGTAGHLELREICDGKGYHVHYKCIPGEICYCRSEEGKRLFGEVPFTSIVEHILDCACSTNYEKISNFLGRRLHVGEYLRCQPNGDYDTIQCMEDKCFCVDAADGARTYPNIAPVNITEISNETLTCFNDELHTEGEYYKPCELEYMKALKTIKDLEKNDNFELIGVTFPNCQLDGFYGAVQYNTSHYYCSDGYGNMLENFACSKEDDLAADMNCLCARSRSLIVRDKPECLENGNYKPVQCRRGFCRCVDENGNQIKKEIAMDDPDFTNYEDECKKK